jgi:hypothetical protein
MSASAKPAVEHDPARGRFTIALDEGIAVLEYRAVDAATLDYHHTFVPPALRGRGLASRLAEFALRYARDQHLKLVPSCPFVAAFIDGHPEFESIVTA